MSLVSHVISNGTYHLEAMTIREDNNVFFKISKIYIHSLINLKGVYFTSKFVRGLSIFEKSFINLVQKFMF